MKRDIERTKKLLLEAAEKLMTGCGDPTEVTSRAITEAAGVNLAMINYCFGSREKLLAEVFSQLLSRAAAADKRFAEVMSSELPPKDKLIELHIFMMSLMLKNIGIARAVTRYILLERDLQTGMESLPFVMAHYGGSKSEAECRLLTFQLTSLNELAFLKYEELKQYAGIDLTDGAQLRLLVTDNISRFLI
ncbi:TetR/AcrR family transcriptional regulator [Ruminococcus sp.]|uniref:TetR/AcrR family transcriptional regulator n=1 Tax=Ruminococcus sp. TaxID=41978 RepID=UPI0025CF3422|nr:TetR/AcrR family transcriptional regulator [Ruminococcus sp.]MCR4638016.1 TetR/AcrR family transcriptional regulator [Ruminococcus sp.]